MRVEEEEDHLFHSSLQHHSIMKGIIIFAALFVLAAAAPQGNPKDAVIVKYENDNIGIGGYNYAFETSDGTSKQEQAELKNVGTENEALVVRGTISWIADDGQQYTLSYIADENGFQPTGAHLPHA